ncbi:hypothetical protein ARAM_005518 [Aspergillus rambellii]|uniref:RING-type E3 ubiquitin transferase n=1 Tax=Aspergillus rambellii TaxID=308745 RepID=A0A0F8VHL0_9EURO|nr:hypothetical protein ARAM_005518 [Aspergillus rambellii]
MRPPRLLIIVFCLLFFPILLTFFSALTSSPRVSTPSSFAGRATGLHALFSFNIPSSLFPPSAIISLTDDNSTFFLARPAAFGPLLPDKSLSGQLWVGSGFGERTSEGAIGELGCSDIPGWGEGDSHKPVESHTGKPGSGDKETTASPQNRHLDLLQGSDTQYDALTGPTLPSTNDGTDDHLHHPLPESAIVDSSASEKYRDSNRPGTHADIQSLQESAEISGKVVLLSRGGCGFLEKVKWAQRRGGIAVIVGDDTRGGSLVTMYARGDTSNVTIPALFTSYTTAHLLSSLIPQQAREEASGTDGSETPYTKVSSVGKEPAAVPSAVPSPSSAHPSTNEKSTGESEPGLLHTLISFLGLGGAGSRTWHLPEDSRRPPSSGNINWMPMGHWDDQELSQIDTVTRGAPRLSGDDSSKDSKTSKSTADGVDGDDFVIGVQDWRDPDLVATRSNDVPVPTNTAASDGSKPQDSDKNSQLTSAQLKGGSITPGSGEYHTLGKPGASKESNPQKSDSKPPTRIDSDESSGKKTTWLSRHFLRGKNNRPQSVGSTDEKEKSSPTERTIREVSSKVKREAQTEEREGLWVTLTPTSMSTSPFFDTLLVLVVSPLLTLTVVYILLLLRSRIRRRRWRAPKSLVDRLPVRTYHTISSSSSSASSLRSLSPGPVSQTSPLLGTKSSSRRARSRPRSQRSSRMESESNPMESPKREKLGDASTMWRRKYTGRQVECVVCLEEYVDGQSRVMSLPCGHEFHAECITPWLTTRRRTCPICKGDVVRSMAQNQYIEARDNMTQNDISHDSDSDHGVSSAPVPISNASEDEMSDLERHASSDPGLLERHSSSTPPSWRNFATLSFSALSGDTIWHQGRTDNDR